MLKICKIKRIIFRKFNIAKSRSACYNFLQSFGARRKRNMKTVNSQMMNAYERRSSRTDNRATVSIVVRWLFFFLVPRNLADYLLLSTMYMLKAKDAVIYYSASILPAENNNLLLYHRFFYSRIFFNWK